MKLIKQEITTALFSDRRLQPLNDPNSKLVLQLFIGCINQKGVKNYELLYGWCVVTSRPEVSVQASVGGFENVFSSDGVTVGVARLTVCNYAEPIIKIVNQLLAGISFKDSAATAGINTDRISFDFLYGNALGGNVKVRPIFFNETASKVSRNMFEKYMLHSPFGNTPSFTLSVVSLDKLKPLRTAEGFLPEHEKILMKILEYLAKETNTSFATTECGRFGNIEFINGLCANMFERAQVFFENVSSEELVNGFKEKTSKKVRVTVLPNEITSSQDLLVNCFSTNGGQVILDEVKEIHHVVGDTVIIEFDTDEPITNLAVSIWLRDGEKWQIWYKNSSVLVRSISTTMGIVGKSGKASSPFLAKALSAGAHLKDRVEKAMEINKTSYQTTTIGTKGLDPWREVDYDFNKFVSSLTIKKSEAMFFPKGWCSDEKEHGALAFLDWFKAICDHAADVIIQDPYFDTVGLEFLARTSNTATSFHIITSTQTPSNDDDPVENLSLFERIKNLFKKPVEEKKVPNRSIRLLNMLKGLPELFSDSKIAISDYRSKSANIKPILHDRYIIVYSNKNEPKGFHMSNSIQNATQNYPLLITPIPMDVLQKVEKHNLELLEKGGEEKSAFEVIKLYDSNQGKISSDETTEVRLQIDEQLLNELMSNTDGDEEPNFDAIRKIFESYISADTLNFEKFWDTFGHFLANVGSGDGMLYCVKDWFPQTKSALLKTYLIELANEGNLNKFRKNRDLDRSGFSLLFENDFDKALESSFWVENGLFENFGFGNYQAGYASWTLLKIDSVNFVNLLNDIHQEIINRKNENLSQKPILRVMGILFTDLVKELFWFADDTVLKICFLSDIMQLRTIAIAAVVTDAVEKKDKMPFDKVLNYFDDLSVNEQVKAYIALLHQTRFDRTASRDGLQKDCFGKLLLFLKGMNQENIFKIIDSIIVNKYFGSIEARATNNLLIPLIDSGSITAQEVLNYWRSKFEIELRDCETTSDNSGVLDLVGWSVYAAGEVEGLEFVTSLEKMSKRYLNIIRKPFMKGTSAWENDYNRLLMIQSVAMVSLNYLNKNDEISIELGSRLNALINEVKSIKINYPYYREFTSIHQNNRELADKSFS